MITTVWANACRFLLAAVFLFSGFVKANDPLGTVYKLQDYLTAWGMASFVPGLLVDAAALVIGVFEFVLGFYLLFGIHRRFTPTLVLMVMACMTPLTLWLALTNPISDCGCFGDAVILTNWQTFSKNIVLLVAAVSLFRFRSVGFRKLVSDKTDWLVALYGVVFIIFYAVYCIRQLPVFDFRPYHIGMDIRQGMTLPEGEKPTTYETTFVYARNGQEREFTLDNFPTDSSWVFVRAKTKVKEQGYEPPIHDFSIRSADDDSDLTDEILNDSSYTFLLVAPWLKQADEAGIDLINEVYDYSREHGYRFLCVTASGEQDIAAWQDNTGAEYPFALMDETTLKTMIRSNPGLMLLKKGVILQKWSTNNLPDEYELNAPLEQLPMGRLNPKTVAHKVTVLAAWFVGPLAFLTLCDLAWLRWRNRRRPAAPRPAPETEGGSHD